jgi:hypothetical protein
VLVEAGDGRLAVVVRGIDGLVYFNRQFVLYGAWSGWSQLGSRAVLTDVAAVAAGTTVDAFASDRATARIWTASVDLDAGLLSETVLDGPTTLEAPAAAFDSNGELRLVVNDGANLRWNRRRPGEPWAGWNMLPRQTVSSRPALLPLGDGRVGIYAIAGPGGELLRTSELASWAAVP